MNMQDEDDDSFEKEFGSSFAYCICDMPEDQLIEIGRALNPEEPAVRHFEDPQLPRYFGNQAELKRAVRALWGQAESHSRAAATQLLRTYRSKP